jgi:hypothetical protein
MAKILFNTAGGGLMPYPRVDDEPVIGLDPSLQIMELVQEQCPEYDVATHEVSKTETIDTANNVVTRGWVVTAKEIVVVPPISMFDNIKYNVIMPARVFGQSLVDDFTTENVMLGITASGKTGLIGDALRDVNFWIDTGSLYEVLKVVGGLKANLDPAWAPFITYDRLTAFEDKIKLYLKIS